MKPGIFQIFGLFAAVSGAFAADPSPSPGNSAKADLVFREISYWHRWSKNDQHEYTPKGQDDLQQWRDMITINRYPDVHDGDGLAAKANGVLENYKSHHGVVLKTNSVPRIPGRPAEHYIAVVFGQPNFIEAAFARFKLSDNTGCSIVYSHRLYGEKIGDQMNAWLSANGPAIEKALMSWSNVPLPIPASQHALLDLEKFREIQMMAWSAPPTSERRALQSKVPGEEWPNPLHFFAGAIGVTATANS